MLVSMVTIEHPLKKLDQQFAYQYDASIQVGMRVKVPFGKQVVVGVVMGIENIDDLKYELKAIIEAIDDEPYYNKELFELAKYMSYNYVASMISCLKIMLPSKLKPGSRQQKIKMEAYVKVSKEADKLTIKQQMAYDALKTKDYLRKEYYDTFKSAGKKLIELGYAQIYEKPQEALFEESLILPSRKLNDVQDRAYHQIIKSEKMVCLLHGITGSGKSEVFLHLSQYYQKQGKQVLILVPEIALTPLMAKQVKQRFGKEVAIYHSGLNDQEKYEQYQLVKQQKVSIVVGTRSALFMPLTKLGLIVMDEEHVDSYKQSNTPSYHARDIALWRAQYHRAKLVLASATPSLESYARAYKHNYELVEMNRRINGELPIIKVIEMRKSIKGDGDYILSKVLKQAIQKAIDHHEQVILLLNRRGYTPLLRCIDCGYVMKCPHCDLALAYHKDDQMMKCHCCHYQIPLIHRCPSCGSVRFQYAGFGTQRLQEHVQACFPQASILRMDQDTTTRKNAHQKILEQFQNHESDILLGTQMIAKGLDFPNVTVVGIVNGDAMLNRSDYRSCELTYDLLEQASGRSGRGNKKGEVYIQVYDENHYAIQSVVNHNYLRFFQEEMKYRHLANYPPYTYLISIVFLSYDEHELDEAINEAKKHLPEDVRVLGPASLLKKKDYQRRRIILKGKQKQRLIDVAQDIYKCHYESKQKAQISIDVDPQYLE